MKKQRLHFRIERLAAACLFLALWIAVVPARIVAATSDGSVSGVVTDDGGKPLRGAPVTARIDNMSVSRYTNASGNYLITGLKPGSYKISATAWGYASKTVDKDISTGTSEVAFSLKANWNPAQISTAEYISAFGNDKDVRNIEGTCQACHNFSWIMRRRGQTAEEWSEFIPRMGTLFFIPELSPEKLTDISASLEKVFGPDSLAPTKEQVHHVEIVMKPCMQLSGITRPRQGI
jgi:hypothetical protein